MPATPIDENDLRTRTEQILDEVWSGCELGPIEPLQGGTSSVTYWTTATESGGAAHRLVLKVAPTGLAPVRNRDVLRQARVQTALQRTPVPAPAVVASHPGRPPEIPPFYAMTFEPGDCLEPGSLPPEQQLPAVEVRGRELHAARILGQLHTVDPVSVGLGDEPEIPLDDEVARWVDMFAACDEDLRAGSEEVGRRLAATVPGAGPSTLVHGDFRLGNTLSRGTEVTSVIDWEIWARGNARVDLAWFLMMANSDHTDRPPTPGMPANDELLATYESSRGARVDDLGWFEALVRYKQAAAGAFIARNARRRGNEASAAAGNPALLASATRHLDALD